MSGDSRVLALLELLQARGSAVGRNSRKRWRSTGGHCAATSHARGARNSIMTSQGRFGRLPSD